MEIPKSFREVEKTGFDVRFVSHAAAILEVDFPDALAELASVLLRIQVPIEELIGSGGGETKGTQRLRRALAGHGWHKHIFSIQKTIDGAPRESTSHEVDHVRTVVDVEGRATKLALEIEWNNKDPFFDRDLENFKRLHAEAAISAGVIITRGKSLQDEIESFVLRWAKENSISGFKDLNSKGVFPTRKQQEAVNKQVERNRNPREFAVAWADKFVADKFGTATTHWEKLLDRIKREVGSPCPLVLIGIPARMITFGEDPAVVTSLIAEGAQGDEGAD